jgi:hypothetical protein
MNQTDPTDTKLALVPLGAGDLVDRAVRFYRRYFWTFILIAAPPVVAGTVISVGWTFLSRSLFDVGSSNNGLGLGLYYLFAWLGTIVIWFTETVATLSVMGGASRNFVRHLLFGEPITFRETYKNTWSRFLGLITASSIITLLLGFLGFIIFYFALIIGFLLIALVVAALQSIPPLAFLVGAVLVAATSVGAVWLFFLVASRFAYVPQVMLVEGQGVFAAIGRSAGLAGGNVKRLVALFFFTLIATYSALAILYVPLGWYAWVEGVTVFSFDGDIVPVWYETAAQLMWQTSLILLSPVWTIGLCLLYVDERVRHEGYDIELMAARRLGDIPDVPRSYVNPLQPALAVGPVASAVDTQRKSSFTTLGLK